MKSEKKHALATRILIMALVFALIVCLGSVTTLIAAAENTEHPGGGYDSMVPIGWIKVVRQTYMAGGAEYFTREVAKGVKYRMIELPEREGDPAVGWRDTVTGEIVEAGVRYAINENTIFEAVYESDLVTVNPNEANMKLDLRQ